MFRLDGKRSYCSKQAQAILDVMTHRLDPNQDDLFALIAYQKDPIDQYLYISAFSGIHEPELMYGPLNFSNFRIHHKKPRLSNNPFAFENRENTKWVEYYDRTHWQLYVNGRTNNCRQDFLKSKDVFLQALEIIYEQTQSQNSPLFPELWYAERNIRDGLRDSVRDLAPGAALEDVALKLTNSLKESFSGLLPSGGIEVGIYLDTGANWELCGSLDNPPFIPQTVEHSHSSAKNSFDWVSESTRPLFVRGIVSDQLKCQLEKCNDSLQSIIFHKKFSGICIAPIIHPHDDSKALGIVMLASRSTEIIPAHVYLLTRFALGIAGYLMPLLPIPGFHWWPEAKLRLGGAKVSLHPSSTKNDNDEMVDIALQASKELMPKNSDVQISVLQPGHSGSAVFKLDVKDEKKIEEVTRVLKIGPANLIEEELKNYYRYAHNKIVGGACRVDHARGLRIFGDNSIRSNISDNYGAIIYTLVGAGERSDTWSNWAQTADMKELDFGLELLEDQLKCWHDRTRGAGESVIDMMLKPLAEGGFQNYLSSKYRTTPTFRTVKNKIQELASITREEQTERPVSCVVHGDLHSDNIFAIFSPDNKIKSVALIDWGLVQSGRHPLSDISKLMVDLAYRVVNTDTMRQKAFDKVQQWGKSSRCGRKDWCVALIHQIAKIMFYIYGQNNNKPYISDAARKTAWEDIKKLEKILRENP